MERKVNLRLRIILYRLLTGAIGKRREERDDPCWTRARRRFYLGIGSDTEYISNGIIELAKESRSQGRASWWAGGGAARRRRDQATGSLSEQRPSNALSGPKCNGPRQPGTSGSRKRSRAFPQLGSRTRRCLQIAAPNRLARRLRY